MNVIDRGRLPRHRATRAEKFHHLIRVLEGLPEPALVLADWQAECGTVACAVGWAMQDIWFNAQGLTARNGIPVYGDSRCWTAVRSFFEIDRGQSTLLFTDLGYDSAPTPAEVIMRIRALGLAEAVDSPAEAAA